MGFIALNIDFCLCYWESDFFGLTFVIAIICGSFAWISFFNSPILFNNESALVYIHLRFPYGRWGWTGLGADEFHPLSGLTDAHFPRTFSCTHDPDFVADRRAALLPAELVATAKTITPIRVCAQWSCLFDLIQSTKEGETATQAGLVVWLQGWEWVRTVWANYHGGYMPQLPDIGDPRRSIQTPPSDLDFSLSSLPDIGDPWRLKWTRTLQIWILRVTTTRYWWPPSFDRPSTLQICILDEHTTSFSLHEDSNCQSPVNQNWLRNGSLQFVSGLKNEISFF